MFPYLHDGTLSGNVKKDKPILIMEDRYTIDEDGLLYRVDTPRQKNLARVKPMTKHLCVPLRFRHDMISYVIDNCGHYAAQSLFHTWQQDIFGNPCLQMRWSIAKLVIHVNVQKLIMPTDLLRYIHSLYLRKLAPDLVWTIKS